MIRTIAILGNITTLGLDIYELVKNGMPSDSENIFIFGLLTLTPLANLLTILLQSPNSWIGLYFKRKALEEQDRISKLAPKP